MSKECITCGKGISLSMQKLMSIYLKLGVDRWFYRVEKGGDWFMCDYDEMKKVLKKYKVKGGYKNGFEYYNIKDTGRY